MHNSPFREKVDSIAGARHVDVRPTEASSRIYAH